MVTRYFVAYDIADPARLRQVHGLVRAAGERIQYSVYEVLMTLRERVLLEAQLKDVMNLSEDQVLFVDLGRADSESVPEVEALGRPYRPLRRGSVIL